MLLSFPNRVLAAEGKLLLRLCRAAAPGRSLPSQDLELPSSHVHTSSSKHIYDSTWSHQWYSQRRRYSTSSCVSQAPHKAPTQHSNSNSKDTTTTSLEDDNDGKYNNITVWFKKENRTLPNLITALRIAASPGLTYAVMHDMKFWALGGCIVFAFSDWLDGYIAKNYNQMSRLGAYLDPLADKVMIGSLSIGLMYRDLLPVELVALILGRDVFLLSMGFLIRALEKPSDAPFFDTTSSATFEIIPSEMSKINTGMQFLLLSSTLGNFACGIPSMVVIEPLWWLTATTTFMSFAGYLDGSGVKFMSKKQFFEQIKAKLGMTALKK